MLVKLIMNKLKILKNALGINAKINASNIIVSTGNLKGQTLDNYLNKRFIYSLNEQIIGTWIDGKPIYRKVVSFNTLNTKIDTGITNLNEMISISCLVKASEKLDGSWRTLPWLFVVNNSIGDNSWAGGFFFKTNGIIEFQVGKNLADISKGYCIIEYTKKDN